MKTTGATGKVQKITGRGGLDQPRGDDLWSQLDRIERMLRWLAQRLNIESLCNAGFHCVNDEKACERLLKTAESLRETLPDISDILEEK